MKSSEIITEGRVNESNTSDDVVKQRFKDTFKDTNVVLQNIQINDRDNSWVKISAKGVKYFRAGTQEKIQFKISCWWNPVSDEASGLVMSQGRSTDRKYSQVLNINDDRETLLAFAYKINTFITDIAMAEQERYTTGEKEYWKKGGRGMMPGSVKKDY